MGYETPCTYLGRAGLRAAVGPDGDGALWMRAPSASERALTLKVLDR